MPQTISSGVREPPDSSLRTNPKVGRVTSGRSHEGPSRIFALPTAPCIPALDQVGSLLHQGRSPIHLQGGHGINDDHDEEEDDDDDDGDDDDEDEDEDEDDDGEDDDDDDDADDDDDNNDDALVLMVMVMWQVCSVVSHLLHYRFGTLLVSRLRLGGPASTTSTSRLAAARSYFHLVG
jgi:hypothetical protein